MSTEQLEKRVEAIERFIATLAVAGSGIKPPVIIPTPTPTSTIPPTPTPTRSGTPTPTPTNGATEPPTEPGTTAYPRYR